MPYRKATRSAQPSAPPEDNLPRRKRSAHFESFAHLLTPAQQGAMQRNYVLGRYGRSLRKTTGRERVALKRALDTLADHGVEVALPPATWGVNGTEEWIDDDQISSRACLTCGARWSAELIEGAAGSPWPGSCAPPDWGVEEAKAHGRTRLKLFREQEQARAPAQ